MVNASNHVPPVKVAPVALRRRLRGLLLRAHAAIARHPRLVALYIRGLAALLRPLPDGGIKEHVLALLGATAWPRITMREVEVSFGAERGLRLVPHFGEFDGEAAFRKRLNYELEVVQFIEERVGDFDAVLEFGANVGLFTLLFSRILQRRNEDARVYAFEPSAEAFHRLTTNLKANGVGNVLAFNAAVATETGLLAFFEPKGHLTNGSLHRDFSLIFSPDVQETRVLAVGPDLIATLVERHPRLLIKIDVEGFEVELLAALSPLFDRHPAPHFIIEVLPGTATRFNAIPVLAERFEIFHLLPGGPCARADFLGTVHRDYYLRPRAVGGCRPAAPGK